MKRAQGSITAGDSARLWYLLKIDFAIMLARSHEGKLRVLEEMVDTAEELTALVINKAKAPTLLTVRARA